MRCILLPRSYDTVTMTAVWRLSPYFLYSVGMTVSWECVEDKDNVGGEIHVDQETHQVVHCDFGCCHVDKGHADWPCCPNTGPIIGIVAGVLVFVALLIGCHHVLCRRRRGNNLPQNNADSFLLRSGDTKFSGAKRPHTLNRHFHNTDCETIENSNSDVLHIAKV